MLQVIHDRSWACLDTSGIYTVDSIVQGQCDSSDSQKDSPMTKATSMTLHFVRIIPETLTPVILPSDRVTPEHALVPVTFR